MVFTGDEFADGGISIRNTLKKENIKASFFFTGRFYRNKNFRSIIRKLKNDGHYLGAHSNDHLLYADWSKRDSLLVTKAQFTTDLLKNYEAMHSFGIKIKEASYFLPPYEWYNDTIAAWTDELDLQLINYTPGTLSHADYTTPADKNYRNSRTIYNSIADFEQARGLNGFILLMHIGTDSKRTDKFYHYLSQLITLLKDKGYQFKRVDTMLQ